MQPIQDKEVIAEDEQAFLTRQSVCNILYPGINCHLEIERDGVDMTQTVTYCTCTLGSLHYGTSIQYLPRGKFHIIVLRIEIHHSADKLSKEQQWRGGEAIKCT